MTDRMTSINPQMLIWAREVSGTSLHEAEEKFGRKLAEWETGKEFPSYAELKKIGDYYRKPIAVFFFPEPPKLKNIPASCRTLPIEGSQLFDRNLTKVVDWARSMQLNLYELHHNINPSPYKLSQIEFDLTSLDATSNQLRSILGISLEKQKKFNKRDTAFEQWRSSFLELGIYIFKNAFKNDLISGFCIYDSEFPVICINNSFAHSRQIFTLFHELYHLICKTSGVDLLDDSSLENQEIDQNNKINFEIEQKCNRFAGAFLVPNSDFLNISKTMRFTDEQIIECSDLYSVSRDVILHKLLENKIINYGFYLEKSEQFRKDYFRVVNFDENGKKKGNGNYYRTHVAYIGTQYLELAYKNYYTKKISLPQLSQYLDMKIHGVKVIAAQKGWGAI
ncbi:MAG: ImmA/IrrE family metallo-endopeptidase [Oscillospiraceae bacterium]|jgi:Zn-dependent peptidase ImmA (M78 family)|nr:ImmA/IrrE family metallo-endopeptidase [Oscillospiraceae bacterium]